MTAPLPFTVVGGFLGAGKTTLLNRLLVGAGGVRFAVLVNDFGALDIDGALVAAHGGDTIALANGCLCCTIGDSLVTTLLRLLERRERIDHIVVEASGVADPGRIADIAAIEPRLARDGTIVLADAASVRERAADRRVGDTIRRQLAAADLVVLNKMDLARDATGLRDWLAAQSSAPVVEATQADVPIAALFGLEQVGLLGGAPVADSFESHCHRWIEPVDRAGLLALLRGLGPQVLRAKGIVRFGDRPDRRSVVHMVGRRIDIDDQDRPFERSQSELVVISAAQPRLGRLPAGVGLEVAR